jgi:hypothetical protein
MRKGILICWILFFSFSLSSVTYAEKIAKKDTVYAPSLEFSYLKNSDGSISLSVNLGVSINRENVAVKNRVIVFYSCAVNPVILDSAITNVKGKALCIIPLGKSIGINTEGFYTFKAVYKGSDSISAQEAEIKVMDLKMEIKYNDDSLKNIEVLCNSVHLKKDPSSLKGTLVNVYVPRTFGLYKIAEGKIDSVGKSRIKIPLNIPGDSIGNILLVAKIEGNSEYGNIEKSELKKWGIPTTKKFLMEKRALWTEVAPRWMIVTLTILLAGVWGHYFYVIGNLIIIRNKGKKQKNIKEEEVQKTETA